MCDIAGELEPDRLERLVDGCLTRRQVDIAELQAMFDTLDEGRRGGRAQLRKLIAVLRALLEVGAEP